MGVAAEQAVEAKLPEQVEAPVWVAGAEQVLAGAVAEDFGVARVSAGLQLIGDSTMGFGGDRRLCFPQSLGVRGGSLQVECGERAFQQPETGCLPGRGLRWFHAAEGPGPVAAEEGGDDGGRVTQFHREVFDANDLNVKVTPVLVLQCGDLVDQCGVVMDAGGGGEDEPGGIEAPRRRDAAS